METERQSLDTRFETPQSANVNVNGISKELSGSIEGEVRFDDGSRALYSTDASNYRQVPIGVVLPRNEEDIIRTVSIAKKYGAPLLTRGGGTSLAGQCCNVALIMDLSKYYNKILHIDAGKKLVKVQTGIVLDHMRKPMQDQYGLTFGPDPATHNHCTIGGMLGNNSCGVHSVMAQHAGNGARTSDNVERLTILTYDGLKLDVGPTSEEELTRIISEGGRKGDIYKKLKELVQKYEGLIRSKFPNIPRRVSGYNLPELLPENSFNVARALVGSESTCVTILDATLKLLPNPKARSLLVLGYPDVYSAGAHAPLAMKHKPVGLEGIDDKLISYMQLSGLNLDDLPLLPKGKGWLLVEFGGETKEESDKKAKELMDELKKEKDPPDMRLYDEPEKELKLWQVRESGLGATAFVPGLDDTWPGWEDSAVPPDKVGEYLHDFRDLFQKYGYDASLYGHFGQGCIHCRINFDLYSHEGMEHYKNFTIEAAKLVARYGGSISGEHGDGQARGDLLAIMYGDELVQVFREFKQIWDPEGKMNPGKIIDTYGQLSNFRIGAHYAPEQPDTYFGYPDDRGNFSRAVLRCVGVGECRRSEGGTMCPSYMVTREENHSTRGRSRMLFEMLQGDTIRHGMKSKYVKESLDLCLACKGCKGDCPVHVDMATYKSEFLAHYYKGRVRPISAYAFGWIYWWARMASHLPRLVNFFTHTPPFSGMAKFLAGVDTHRTIPEFARQTFREWYKGNCHADNQKPKVILWADTFNNFFLPNTLKAAAEVIAAAGFQVIVPRQMLCCGRPLYDFGMLKTAKKLLLQILDSLLEEIRQGTPVVGLEPSCVAVFREELCNLLPYNENAKRLKNQVFTLDEFLVKKAPQFAIPLFEKKAIVHGHCHHKAIMTLQCERMVLDKMKIDYEVPDTGCCGMAGYFGYEKGEHYDISVKAGERVLLPAVRKAAKDVLIIADGFSCREQIRQQTGRSGLHIAEVLQMAIKNKSGKL